MSAVVASVLHASAPLRPVRLGAFDAVLEREASGVIHIRTGRKGADACNLEADATTALMSDRASPWARASPENP